MPMTLVLYFQKAGNFSEKPSKFSLKKIELLPDKIRDLTLKTYVLY